MLPGHLLERAVAGAEIEIEAETSRDFETSGETSRYGYELLFTDGSRRVCVFAYTVGDEATHPYLVLDGERALLLQAPRRSSPADCDEMDNYLLPLSATVT